MTPRREGRLQLGDLPPPREDHVGWPWQGESLSFPISRPQQSITVVTPNFNQGAYLETAIRSVLLQGNLDLEYIVIDGGSNDDSVEVLKRYDPWISFWISESDEGQSHAINKGFERATGDWVAWLNADDIYLPGALHTALSRIEDSKSHIDWLVGTTQFVDASLNPIALFEPDYLSHPSRDDRFITHSWLDFVCSKKTGTSLPQPSSLFHVDAYRTVGKIDERLHLAMDHEFYSRLGFHGYRPTLFFEPIAAMRIHPAQKSAQGDLPFLREEIAVVDKWRASCSGKERKLLSRYRSHLIRRLLALRARQVRRALLRR